MGLPPEDTLKILDNSQLQSDGSKWWASGLRRDREERLRVRRLPFLLVWISRNFVSICEQLWSVQPLHGV